MAERRCLSLNSNEMHHKRPCHERARAHTHDKFCAFLLFYSLFLQRFILYFFSFQFISLTWWTIYSSFDVASLFTCPPDEWPLTKDHPFKSRKKKRRKMLACSSNIHLLHNQMTLPCERVELNTCQRHGSIHDQHKCSPKWPYWKGTKASRSC